MFFNLGYGTNFHSQIQHHCGDLNKIGPYRLIYLLSHQLVALFKRIRRIRRCGLFGKCYRGIVEGRGQTVWFKMPITSSVFLSWPEDQDVALGYFSSTVCKDVGAMMIMD